MALEKHMELGIRIDGMVSDTSGEWFVVLEWAPRNKHLKLVVLEWAPRNEHLKLVVLEWVPRNEHLKLVTEMGTQE